MILNDKQIKKLAEEKGMITPFLDKSVSNGISKGLQSYGYDISTGSEFKIFTNIKGNVVADPKNFSEDNFVTVKNDESIFHYNQALSFDTDEAQKNIINLKKPTK